MRYCLLFLVFIAPTMPFTPTLGSNQWSSSHSGWNLYGSSRLISTDQIPLYKNSKILSFGNPKIIAPGRLGTQWLLWHHMRDDKIDPDVLLLSSGRVMFATSDDGLNWSYHPDSPALHPSKDSGDWFLFDSEHVGVGDVIEPGQIAQSKFATQQGMLVMYTFGGNSDSKPSMGDSARIIKGSRMEIGVAVSQDGAHWSRVEGPSPQGAIVPAGAEGEFDHFFAAFPSVVEAAGCYKMYYHTYDPIVKRYVVGLAEARDGLLTWRKRGPVFSGGHSPGDFDFAGVTRRFVGRLEDGSLQMWYEGVSASRVHSIGVARSTDRGDSWTRLFDLPVFEREPGGWDSGGVGSPHCVWLPERRRWRLYYMGDSADRSVPPALGVAESTDESGHSFVRLDVDT